MQAYLPHTNAHSSYGAQEAQNEAYWDQPELTLESASHNEMSSQLHHATSTMLPQNVLSQKYDNDFPSLMDESDSLTQMNGSYTQRNLLVTHEHPEAIKLNASFNGSQTGFKGLNVNAKCFKPRKMAPARKLTKKNLFNKIHYQKSKFAHNQKRSDHGQPFEADLFLRSDDTSITTSISS